MNKEQNVDGLNVSPAIAKPMSGEGVRSAAEIRAAINAISNNRNLTYSYREDVIAVLEWVLTGEPFNGLDES